MSVKVSGLGKGWDGERGTKSHLASEIARHAQCFLPLNLCLKSRPLGGPGCSEEILDESSKVRQKWALLIPSQKVAGRKQTYPIVSFSVVTHSLSPP